MSIATAEGLGLAGATLDGLVQACAKQGFWKLVSRIFPENTASLAPHERAGFRVVGTYVERLLEAALGDGRRARARGFGQRPGERASHPRIRVSIRSRTRRKAPRRSSSWPVARDGSSMLQ